MLTQVFAIALSFACTLEAEREGQGQRKMEHIYWHRWLQLGRHEWLAGGRDVGSLPLMTSGEPRDLSDKSDGFLVVNWTVWPPAPRSASLPRTGLRCVCIDKYWIAWLFLCTIEAERERVTDLARERERERARRSCTPCIICTIGTGVVCPQGTWKCWIRIVARFSVENGMWVGRILPVKTIWWPREIMLFIGNPKGRSKMISNLPTHTDRLPSFGRYPSFGLVVIWFPRKSMKLWLGDNENCRLSVLMFAGKHQVCKAPRPGSKSPCYFLRLSEFLAYIFNLGPILESYSRTRIPWQKWNLC